MIMKNMLKERKILNVITIVVMSFIIFLSGCSASKSKEVSKPILWINGTYAVLTKINNGDVKIFGGWVNNNSNKEMFINSLKNDWDITTKEQLDETINSLKAGMHNPELLNEVINTGIDQMSKTDFEEAIKEVESKEDVDYYTNIYNAYEKFGNNAIMGWDLSRATQLCAYGYISGFYTYEEATNNAIEVGKQIQKTFDSWDSFYDSYMFGYEFWSEDDMSDPSSDYNTRLTILDELKKDPKSPYNLDWNLDLSVQ